MDPRFEIIVGRIERLALDAVVNAANKRLLPGSGVDGALRAAAGSELTRHTRALPPLEPGQALITPGFNAPAKHIIHVAAPVWHEPGDKLEKMLELGHCYISAVRVADEHKLPSIGFPCLGTGVYGWPAEAACEVALAHVSAAMADVRHVQRVVFCCFTERDAEIYRAALKQ